MTLRINVGQEVEAQWDEDGLWYRAVITVFDSAQAIRVHFTKYGGEQQCGIGQLRPVIESVTAPFSFPYMSCLSSR